MDRKRGTRAFAGRQWLCVLLALCCLLTLAACGKEETPEAAQPQTDAQTLPFGEAVQENVLDAPEESGVQEILAEMPLEDKVSQLFIVNPEALPGVDPMYPGESLQSALDQYPVGGFLLMAANLEGEEQARALLEGARFYSLQRVGLQPFLCVDEEGGTVRRISGSGKFNVPEIGNMDLVGASGNPDGAYEVGAAIGNYLKELGFNLDFAPVADVLSNPENTVVKRRSFGSDPQLVSSMALALARGLESQGILSVFKHFPGHGATAEDSHTDFASNPRSLDELEACDLIPFRAAVEQGCQIIMVGHIALPAVTGTDVPASLSWVIIQELLRDRLGYDGLVVTDAMNMGAISQRYGPGETAVLSLQAGADLILCPGDFPAAYAAVLNAVQTGELSLERIDQSVARVLALKLSMDTEE